MPGSTHPKNSRRTPSDIDRRNSGPLTNCKPNAWSHADAIDNADAYRNSGTDSDAITYTDAFRYIRSFGDAGSNVNRRLANHHTHLSFRSLAPGESEAKAARTHGRNI